MFIVGDINSNEIVQLKIEEKEMERNESQIYSVSKRERLFALTIFVIMIVSFFFHLCAFGDVFFKDGYSLTDLSKNQTDSLELNLLPFFCIFAHLIWTIVPMVVLDQCCLSTHPSILQIIFKLFLCTIPLLLCSELSWIFVCHINLLTNHFLIIAVKWLVFLATIFICFWTGILSNKNKWRGIHGGQIAPELHSPLYRFEN